MSDNLVTIMVEVDSDLLTEVEKVLKPYGLTPEQAVVDFLNFCVNPATRDKAASLLLQWKNEQKEKM
ncbi:MAG: hypothetical protein Q4D50_10045 [Eubacteriales bacterium]|nr:hypothetical protein [Eubacteriales bacterium]